MNHISHGIITLDRLGASEDITEDYISRYNHRLEGAQDRGAEEWDAPLLQEDEAKALLGKRKSFYRLVKYYEQKLEECGSVDVLLKTEFPKLSAGIIAAALHGAIHLGYGIAGENKRVILEGLAYLHYTHDPIIYDEDREENGIERFGKGSIAAYDLFDHIRQDKKLLKIIEDGLASRTSGGRAAFGTKARFLMEAGNELLLYVNKIAVPALKEGDDVNNEELMIKLADWLVDQAIIVYTFSENRNGFFLLHGVTGSWAMRQIIPFLSPADAMIALRTLTATLIAAYVVCGAPVLNPANGQCSGDVHDARIWDHIIEETFSEKRDTHRYKLVQVCRDCWLNLKDKTDSMAEIYAASARSCLTLPYSRF